MQEKQWIPWTITVVCLMAVVGSLFYSLTLQEDFIAGGNYFAVRKVWFGKIDSQLFLTGSQIRIDTHLHRSSKGGTWWQRHLYVESGSRRAEIAFASHSARLDYAGVEGILAECANDATVQIGETLSQLTGWELIDTGSEVVRQAYQDS